MRPELFLPVPLLLGCAGRAAHPPEGPQVQIRLDVTTDRPVYSVGDPVFVRLTVRNATDAAVTLWFPTGQRYDFAILNATQDTVWRWSADKGFIQAVGEERVGPGQELAFTEEFQGPLPPGRYTVQGMLAARGGPFAAAATIHVR